MTPSPPVTVYVSQGVGFITWARPERLNAITAVLLDETTMAIAQLEQDASVRVIVLAGEGRAFSAGADITAADPDDPSDPGEITSRMLDALTQVIEAIRFSDLPIVAAINGLAVGVGASIAFACDLPVATASAYFSLPFVNLGLVPDGGATKTVTDAVGYVRAMRLALLGERFTAAEAADYGLIAEVYPDDEFQVRVGALAARLAAGPRGAHAAIKSLIRAPGRNFEVAMRAEKQAQLERTRTAEFIEGITAVRQRRLPQFP